MFTCASNCNIFSQVCRIYFRSRLRIWFFFWALLKLWQVNPKQHLNHGADNKLLKADAIISAEFLKPIICRVREHTKISKQVDHPNTKQKKNCINQHSWSTTNKNLSIVSTCCESSLSKWVPNSSILALHGF